MDISTICIGNYLLKDDRWITVENVFPKSINLEVDILPDSIYSVKSWILLSEIKPITLTSPILEDLGFRYDYQRYTYPIEAGKVYIVRRGERFFFAVENDRNILTEITGVHHLQNLMFFLFGIKIVLKRNRWRYFGSFLNRK